MSAAEELTGIAASKDMAEYGRGLADAWQEFMESALCAVKEYRAAAGAKADFAAAVALVARQAAANGLGREESVTAVSWFCWAWVHGDAR